MVVVLLPIHYYLHDAARHCQVRQSWRVHKVGPIVAFDCPNLVKVSSELPTDLKRDLFENHVSCVR